MKIKCPVIFTVLTLFSLTSVVSFAQKPDSIQLKDDFTGWIYQRIQYVAKQPLTRADLLTETETQAKAWRQPKTPEEIQAWLDLLTNQGYIWLLNGNIVRSTDSYTSAFQWAKEHAAQTDPAQVLDNILKPLGNNYTRLGDFEQALTFIDPETLKDHPLSALDKERYKQVRVASYTERPPVPAGKGEIVQIVEIGLVNINTQTERSIVDRQLWRYDEKTKHWHNVSGLPDITQH